MARCSGAFVSLLGITFLNEICSNISNGIKPSYILEQLRNNVIDAIKHNSDEENIDNGMDIALCVYDIKKQRLQYSGANNSMYHVRNGVLTEYKPVRNPIGDYPSKKDFETLDVDIKSGDWIYLFSDGLADQFWGDD
mgnify:FL=1